MYSDLIDSKAVKYFKRKIFTENIGEVQTTE